MKVSIRKRRHARIPLRSADTSTSCSRSIPASLGRRPDDLPELVTELALGAPGILAARTLAAAGLDDTERRRQAAQLAYSFWKLFNRPAVIRLLQQLAGDSDTSGRTPYWRLVIRYCIDGNLQAVLDEYWHLTWEQHAWSEREQREEISKDACGKSPIPSSHGHRAFKQSFTRATARRSRLP